LAPCAAWPLRTGCWMSVANIAAAGLRKLAN
jgi:hypothetical protein